MVDLTMLQVVRDLVAIFGVIAGFSYYVMTVRNSQRNQKQQLETRQAQLFMEVYREYRGLEFRKQRLQVMSQEWTDFDNWWAKYGGFDNPEEWANWQAVAAYFNGIGVLVKRGLVDIGLVDDLLSNIIPRHWRHMEPIIIEWRERVREERSQYIQTHELIDGFEYLYNEHQRYMKEHPELQIR